MINLDLVSTLISYLGGIASKSDGFEEAKNQVSTEIWEWIRPIFLKDDEPLKDLLYEDNELNRSDVQNKILKAINKNPKLEASLNEILKSQNILRENHSTGGVNISSSKIKGKGNITIVGRDINS